MFEINEEPPRSDCHVQTTRRTRAKDIIPRVWPNTDASGATIELHGLLCTSPEALFAKWPKSCPSKTS